MNIEELKKAQALTAGHAEIQDLLGMLESQGGGTIIRGADVLKARTVPASLKAEIHGSISVILKKSMADIEAELRGLGVDI